MSSYNKITVLFTDPRQVVYYYDQDQSQLALKVTYSPNAFEGKGVFHISKAVLIGDRLTTLLEILIDAKKYIDGIVVEKNET